MYNNTIIIIFFVDTVDCGSPTAGRNVIIEGVVGPRVPEGTNVIFRCPSEQSYILKGPSVATCSSSGVWEPYTSADNVQCIGKYIIILQLCKLV